MRKLADFGLEKIPTEALLSMARQENGKLQAYITELEDKLEATQIELKSLKAYMESDIYSISASERKRENKEFRKDQYVRNLIEQTNKRVRNAKMRDKQNKDLRYYLYRKIDQLERVVKYTFNNVGNTFSAKSISDYLKAEHRALDNETVYSYLEKLEKAYLLHRCSRFDLQGKEILKTQEKFYLADTALRYSVLGYNADSVASSLENVVYLELCRRGYTVNVGKSGSGEIDFVAVRQNEKLYVQVTQELRSPKTEKREYERLLEIHDNYPKYVLTTDEFSGGNYEGIKTMHIADFLLSSEY